MNEFCRFRTASDFEECHSVQQLLQKCDNNDIFLSLPCNFVDCFTLLRQRDANLAGLLEAWCTISVQSRAMLGEFLTSEPIRSDVGGSWICKGQNS